MSNQLDPHHLVALMSQLFNGTQDGSSCRLDPSSHTLKYGIVDNHQTNVRTFPILDAIANISVSWEKSQVIAVALQMDIQRKAIRLTIADNQGVGKALLQHPRSVWGNFQTLSSEYEEQRTGGSDKPEYEFNSPAIPSLVALPLRIQIFRDIYSCFLEKQMKRINKWYLKLGYFTKALLKHRGPPNLQEFEVTLLNAVIALVTAIELVLKLHAYPECQLTDQEWAKVYLQSMKANQDVREVLADRDGTGCEVLVEELKGMTLLLPLT